MPSTRIGRKRLMSQVYSLQSALYPESSSSDSNSESSSSSEDDPIND